MSRRFGMLYSDGSMNICPDGADLVKARKELEGSSDDGDTELIEIEVKVMQTFGPKEARVIERSVPCPCCGTEVSIEDPSPESKDGKAS